MATDVIFQKNLQDIVKGIRTNKKSAGEYISQVIADAKIELKSTNPHMKAEAVRKLTYLQALGYNISWASFAIVEVMSQPKFGHKRIGYLAANQSFNDSTDVILLTTNLFKKEMGNVTAYNYYDIGLAINCLSNIVTNDLAKDCISDVLRMMNHQKAYVRKKAVLSMFKLYVKYPQGLRLTFEKLKEHLDDSEASVISCVVNVICELSNKNAKNYVSMAPKFFSLLTTSTNNWMLIKLVKLMGSLVSEEPRLARKLLDPLAAIIQSSPAKSIQFECINTITEALMYTKREDGTDAKSAPAVVKLCANYLRGFIEDNDPNLKFLGLVGLNKLMVSHPRSIVEQREVILRCLNDPDVTLRIKALELLAGIVTKKNLIDLVHHLLDKASNHAEGSWRNEIIRQILIMGSKDKFSNVEDFAWYISVLSRLAGISGSNHGIEVSDQLMEVVVRVESARPHAVECMLSILLNQSLLLGVARDIVSEVLKAAVWIIGEYSSTLHFIKHDAFSDEDIANNEDLGFWIEGPLNEDVRSVWRGQNVHTLVLDTILHPRVTNLPNHVQSAFLMSTLKVFVRTCADENESDIALAMGIIRSRLQVFLQSHNMEVQERASTLRHLLSELDILSLTWHVHAMVEESKSVAKNELRNASSNDNDNNSYNAIDLLDLDSPIAYTAGSIKAIDDKAAKAAFSKRAILLATMSESFYPVHPKAQKKVPKPAGIDMAQAISASAVKKVLGLELPSNCFISGPGGANLVTLTNLNFVKPAERSLTFYEGGDNSSSSKLNNASSNNNYNYNINNNNSNSGSGNGFSNQSSLLVGNSSSQFSSDPSSRAARNGDESLFYLSSNDGHGSRDNLVDGSQHQSGLKPLSQIFEIDSSSSRKKNKKSKDKDKRTDRDSRGSQSIDNRDMLPAGAVDSEDEEGQGGGYSSQKPSQSSSTRRISRNRDGRSSSSNNSSNFNSNSNSNSRNNTSGDGELVDLGHVDITTPLEKHEVLSDRKHREVSSSSSRGLGLGPKDEEKDGGGSSKKEKSKKKKKDVQNADDFDLLNFESSSNNSKINNSMPAAISKSITNISNNNSNNISVPIGKSKSNNAVWLPLVTDDKYDVLYSVANVTRSLLKETDDDLVISVNIKVVNYSKFPLTVDFIASNNNNTNNSSNNNNNVIRSNSFFPSSASNSSKTVSLCNFLQGGSDQNTAVKSFDFTASSDVLAAHFMNSADIDISGICKFVVHNNGGDAGMPLISVDNSSGTTLSVSATLKIYECLTFTSNENNSSSSAAITSESIENILLKSSHSTGSAKIVVPMTIKWKSAIKAVSSFVNGTIVESDNKAFNASIYSQTLMSGHVCILVKSKKTHQSSSPSTEENLKIEVKCVCATKKESQSTANNVIRALGGLML